jgi:5-methylcytosine-specific restriction endonuclease McrA
MHPDRDKAARDRYEARHEGRHNEYRAKLTPEQRAEVAAKKKDWRKRTRETTRLVEIKNAEKRRARLAQVEYVDINRAEVFERDAGISQLCGLEVDYSIQWPDPGFASIDHIKMVRDGGPHTMENVRLAHLRCNQSRPRSRSEATEI